MQLVKSFSPSLTTIIQPLFTILFLLCFRREIHWHPRLQWKLAYVRFVCLSYMIWPASVDTVCCVGWHRHGDIAHPWSQTSP